MLDEAIEYLEKRQVLISESISISKFYSVLFKF